MNINDFVLKKERQEKITMLTCYDSTFAEVLQSCKLDSILVGDSLGMVIKGDKTTLTVSLDEIKYHLKCVSAKSGDTFLIVDMPFSTFQENPEKTFSHAAKLMDAGAQMVKLEGGSWLLDTVEFLTTRGIPVCTHLGMLPQSIHKIGYYRKFGSTEQEKDLLVKTAASLESAGSELLILELVNSSASKQITEVLKIPTVGIGSGKFVDGQVLVLYDILGIGNKLSFAKNFLSESNSIEECIKNYIQAVKKGIFPEN